jgi:hypothetical protein
MKAPRWSALLLIAALVAHTIVSKLPGGRLWDMLFGCHVATAILIAGILARNAAAAAVGLTFHLGVGLWTCVIDAWSRGGTSPTSVAVHILPIVIGAWAVAGTRPPWWTPLGSWGMFVALLPISYLLTPPHLNVNVAHGAHPAVRSIYPDTLLAGWALTAAVTLPPLVLAHLAIRRMLGRR